MLGTIAHCVQFDFDCSSVMAKSIKLFQQLENVYQSLGIRTSQPKFGDRVSFKCYLFLTSLAIISTFSVVYFLFAAKSVAERGDAFYIGTSQQSNIFYIITYIRGAPQIRHLIGKFEIFFAESESLIFYLRIFFLQIN